MSSCFSKLEAGVAPKTATVRTHFFQMKK